MALKSTYSSEEKGAEIEEALDALEALIDRVKVLYEQYFMGIQKQAPAHLHQDTERRLRDLAQMQIRNTALRYRFATLQQKYGSYNSYWKRTVREIESGRYIRNLIKVRQKAQQNGEDIPDEIVAKMPKRMRDAIAHDRQLALAKAVREHRVTLPPELGEFEADARTINEAPRFAAPADPRAAARDTSGGFRLEEAFDDEGDIAAALSSLADEALAAVESRPPPSRRPEPRDTDVSPMRPPSAPSVARVTPPSAPSVARVAPPSVPSVARVAPPVAPVAAAPPPSVTPPARPAGLPPLGPRPTPSVTPSGVHPRPAAATPAPGATPRLPPLTPPPVGAARGSAPSVPVTPPPAEPPSITTARVAPPSGARPAAAQRVTASPIPGMSEADTRALYAKYIKARDVVGDRTDPMSYDKLVRTLSSQAPKILEQHKAAGVEFKVVIKDNKVVLKARPK